MTTVVKKCQNNRVQNQHQNKINQGVTEPKNICADTLQAKISFLNSKIYFKIFYVCKNVTKLQSAEGNETFLFTLKGPQNEARKPIKPWPNRIFKQKKGTAKFKIRGTNQNTASKMDKIDLKTTIVRCGK